MDSSSVSKTEGSGSYPDPPAISVSSNGRTSGFGPENLGSNPRAEATQDPNRCENCQTMLKFYACKSVCVGCGLILGCSEGV